jgi:hypothetical protein
MTGDLTSRTIGRSDRPWVNKELQQFVGRFELDAQSGLYFDCHTPSEHRALISATFLKLPVLLRNAAITLGLTVSTTMRGRTRSGHLSTAYGAWDESDPARISPHIEMSIVSLSPELIVAHLAHEISHVFWAVQSQSAQALYTGMMRKLALPNFQDVTEYARQFFAKGVLDKWVLESFCETVGKLCYPAYGDPESAAVVSVLAARHAAMQSSFGLTVQEIAG